MLTDEELYYIVLPYACYGLIVRNGFVGAAPPIAKWMTGKDIGKVLKWVRRKGGTWKQIQ